MYKRDPLPTLTRKIFFLSISTLDATFFYFKIKWRNQPDTKTKFSLKTSIDYHRDPPWPMTKQTIWHWHPTTTTATAKHTQHLIWKKYPLSRPRNTTQRQVAWTFWRHTRQVSRPSHSYADQNMPTCLPRCHYCQHHRVAWRCILQRHPRRWLWMVSFHCLNESAPFYWSDPYFLIQGCRHCRLSDQFCHVWHRFHLG